MVPLEVVIVQTRFCHVPCPLKEAFHRPKISLHELLAQGLVTEWNAMQVLAHSVQTSSFRNMQKY
jgi:hypothetical protein